MSAPGGDDAAAPEHACPVCAASLAEGAVRACPRCETPHHADCWEFTGGCAIFGCAAAAAAPLAPPAAPRLDLAATQVRAFAWIWAQRLQSLLALGLGLSILVLPLGLLASGFVGVLADPTQAAPASGGWVGLCLAIPVGMGLAFMGSQVLVEALRRRLAQSAGTALPSPKQAIALADRLELAGLDRLLAAPVAPLRRQLRWVYPLAWVVLSLGYLVRLPDYSTGLDQIFGIGFLGFVLGCLWMLGGGVLGMVADAVTGRPQLVRSIQNRLVASSKAQG